MERIFISNKIKYIYYKMNKVMIYEQKIIRILLDIILNCSN